MAKRANQRIPRDDQWTEGDVINVLCNPFHVYCGTISADQWVQAMLRLVEEQGLENTLRRVAAVYDEAADAKGDVEESLAEQLLKSFADNAGQIPLEEMFRRVLDGLDSARR
jgi:hypothetical protein